MTAGQINEPMQETAGGFADTAADAPTPKLSLEGKDGRGWDGLSRTIHPAARC